MGNELYNRRNRRLKKGYIIIKFTVLILIIIGIPLYIYFFHRGFVQQFDSMASINSMLEKYKTESIYIYMGSQILQIVIAAIPGQALQIAAGYVYGVGTGYVFSLIGAFLGSIATFYLGRLLGRDAMYLIFGREKMQSFIDRLNSKRAFIIVFLIYLIPGIPKDLFNYAAGVSNMKCKAFLLVSLAGRTPGMIGSLAIGKMLKSGSYTGIIILSSIAAVLFIVGALYHKKVHLWLDRMYDKIIK